MKDFVFKKKLVGLIYGLIGALRGFSFPRELEGSIILLFLANIDEALASGLIRTDSFLTKFFPLHYPYKLFKHAVEGQKIGINELKVTLGYLGVFLIVSLFVYSKITDKGGFF